MENTNTKTNKKLIVIAILLTLVASVALTMSLAKYTEQVKVEDTAKIAKWDVSLSAEENFLNHEFSVNLLSTVGEDAIIAPGVSGSIPLSVTNSGDVTVAISGIDIEEAAGNANIPLEFSTDNTTWGTSEAAKATLVASASEIEAGDSATVGTLYWRWPFDVNATQDETDTALGEASAEAADRTSYTLSISMTATQVMPTVAP